MSSLCYINIFKKLVPGNLGQGSMQGKFIDKLSLVIAAATLITSFTIFYSDTKEFGGSFTAALMTAGLVWSTYIVLRWLLIANRN